MEKIDWKPDMMPDKGRDFSPKRRTHPVNYEMGPGGSEDKAVSTNLITHHDIVTFRVMYDIV
jgi:hypothetical protein